MPAGCHEVVFHSAERTIRLVLIRQFKSGCTRHDDTIAAAARQLVGSEVTTS
jgi:hypothetical protein